MKDIYPLVQKEDLIRWARGWQWLYDPRLLTMLGEPRYQCMSPTGLYAFGHDL